MRFLQKGVSVCTSRKQYLSEDKIELKKLNVALKLKGINCVVSGRATPDGETLYFKRRE